MSITGSLVGYENNNDVNNKRNRALLNISSTTNNSTTKQQCPSLNSSISNSVITTASSNCSAALHHKKQLKQQELAVAAAAVAAQQQQIRHGSARKSGRFHLNTLWSVWYGVLVTLFQGYLILQGAHRYLGCKLLSWKYEPPTTELDIQITVCGLVILFLPLFLASAVYKVGNFANDGVKLATGTGRCSAEPADGLEVEAKGGTLKALWTHGGPTSSFLHIITALCLLLPRLLLESKLIENGHLPKDNVWRTELDFMIAHKDRSVVLSFLTANNTEHQVDTRLPSAPVFEKTHLIERIHDEYDDDMYDTHENLQSEIPFEPSPSLGIVSTQQDYESERVDNESWPSTLTTTTSTRRPTTVQARTTMTTVRTIPVTRPSSTTVRARTLKTTSAISTVSGLIIMDQVTTTTTAATTTTTAKTTTTMPSTIQSTTTTTSATTIKQKTTTPEQPHTHKKHHRTHHRKHGKHHKKERRREEEPDSHLELIPDHGIDFDDLLDADLTPIFETASGAKKPSEFSMTPQEAAKPWTHLDTNVEVFATHPVNVEEKTPKLKKPVKDSDVHILKPEILPELPHIPSTTVTTNSKIIEIKPSQGALLTRSGLRRAKRSARGPYDDVVPYGPNMPSVEEDDVIVRDEETGLEIRPSYLIGAIPGNMSILEAEFSGLAKLVKAIIGHTHPFDAHNWSFFPSLEFVNFVVAIVVFSVRYPSVFWATSKPFATVFSIQMVANGIDILVSYAGISALYKLQNTGPSPSPASGLLLNGIVTISLYLFAVLLTILSSMVLYLYGHGRLSAKMRDRRMITVNKAGDAWSYFAHCASLCFVLAVAVVKAPIMHDLSTVYRNSLDGSVLAAALGSVIHLFLWIVLWLGLTAKRRWDFKLPPLEHIGGAAQPLLMSPRGRDHAPQGEEQIYWPKIAPNSPKLKVTFNEVPSTSSDHDLSEHDGKRNPIGGAQIRLSAGAIRQIGEIDDGDYATLRGPLISQLQMDDYGILPLSSHDHAADDTGSEEGKLLACVRDDSVTYASTRDLLPPTTRELSPEYITSPNRMMTSPNRMLASPLGPVSVTVHATEVHISSVTPRCLRRADSGVPNEHESLTPRSDTTSTESSTSPPEKANSESSSGVHSGEEKDEVVIRPRPPSVPYKSIIKSPPNAVADPFGRSTNMQMSSFKENGSSATLPNTRNSDARNEYPQCNTMPLPIGNHNQYKPQPTYSPAATPTGGVRQQQHTTLPNGLRYSSNQYLRRMPHVKNAESPYGHLGMGSGHHTFSKLLHDPLALPAPPMSTFASPITQMIPEDRDSANYSMISDQDREMYLNASQISQIQIN